jgi:hypothetical protein
MDLIWVWHGIATAAIWHGSPLMLESAYHFSYVGVIDRVPSGTTSLRTRDKMRSGTILFHIRDHGTFPKLISTCMDLCPCLHTHSMNFVG